MTVQSVHNEPLPIPMFEGQAVDATVLRISGRTPIEDDAGVIVSVDDVVLLLGEYRVVSIRHYSDKDGNFIREQVLKPIRTARHPWNPADPNDDGVVRSGPRTRP